MKKHLSIILLLLWSMLITVGLLASGGLSNESDILVKTSQGNLTITPYAANIFRIAMSEAGKTATTDAIVMEPEQVSVITENIDGATKIFTDSLSVWIDNNTSSLQFFDSRGKLIVAGKGFFSDSINSGFRFNLSLNEMIFGGGEGAIPINRRGYRLNLNNEPHWGYGWGEENLNYSVPHFISSSNYSIFFDDGAIGYADIGKSSPNQLEIASIKGEKSFFFIANSNQGELHKSFTRLVGTQPMPPRWAMGNLMSRFGYQNEKEAREKLDSMLNAGYPVDAIILDLYWFGQGSVNWMMGDLDWYKPAWPTPEKMIADFKKKGVQTILITEPYVLQSSKNFAEADKKLLFAIDSTGETNIVKDFWFGPAGLIDLFKPEACDWYWQFYKKQIDLGVAGWWGDLGEPEKFHNDLIFQRGEGATVRNLYGHYWSKMLSDHYAKYYPDKRLFHLNRAGFAGSQRYSSFPWSGDVSRTWGGFKAQLPNMLSMSLSNIPYAHSDLGGFCAEPKNEELYLRWLQFGVFNPVFRPHSEKVPSEPIYYSDSIQRLVKPFFNLRYQLLPYNYTLTWRQEQFGEPLAAPLFMKIALSKTMWDIFDEYFWGDAFLVAPVLEKGQEEKSIFLPNGIWFDFFSGERLMGDSYVKRKIILSTFPVFVKAGSFVPMIKPIINTSVYDHAELELHYWYDRSVQHSSYQLYDDDGITRDAFKKGLYELTTFSFSSNEGKLVFNFENRGGEYQGRPDELKIKLMIHNLPQGFSVEGMKTIENISTIEVKLQRNQSTIIEFKLK